MLKTVKMVAVGVLLLLAVGCAETTQDDESSEPAQQTAEQPKKKAPKRTARERLETALPEEAEVEIASGEITVTVPTPEGGFDGASTGDLNREASVIFHAIHGTAGYERDSVVVFKGGLVSSETGEELPDVNTGIFTMPRDRAAEINWSDDDVWRYTIDWTRYRDFAHPALKDDD